MIEFACPECGRPIKVADHHAGKTGKCNDCKHSIRIPGNIDAVSSQKQKAVSPNAHIFWSFVILIAGTIVVATGITVAGAYKEHITGFLRNATSANTAQGLDDVRSWLRSNLDAPEWVEVTYYPPRPIPEITKYNIKHAEEMKLFLLNEKSPPDKETAEQYQQEINFLKDDVPELFCKIEFRAINKAGGYEKSEIVFHADDTGSGYRFYPYRVPELTYSFDEDQDLRMAHIRAIGLWPDGIDMKNLRMR